VAGSPRTKAFAAADELAERVWRASDAMRVEDRRDLGSQLRRAALSVPCNLLEGSSRKSARERLRFVEIADGSLRECGYLLDFAARLGVLPPDSAPELVALHARVAVVVSRRRSVASRGLKRRAPSR
jgi:four helix bundle protein